MPKTLIFAKDDNHADDIVRICRAVFGKGNDFCQKITYRTGFIRIVEKKQQPDGSEVEEITWKRASSLSPEEILSAFRNSYFPRIAVTVDMIATGTDIKPLEIVFFMRSVASKNFFEQMKGRGVRVVSDTEMEQVNPGIGITSQAGRYGGTYAHKDIAFEFASWVSVEFKLYLIKEFQRLKDDENRRLSLAWNLNRTLSKLNYRIHTDAVKAHLIPPEITPAQAAITYANEADLLNVALFGQTAKQWRDANPKLEDNMREYATIEQLLVLANIEGMNAEFIHMALPQGDRLKRLNAIAIRQMQTLTASSALRQLEPPKSRKE